MLGASLRGGRDVRKVRPRGVSLGASLVRARLGGGDPLRERVALSLDDAPLAALRLSISASFCFSSASCAIIFSWLLVSPIWPAKRRDRHGARAPTRDGPEAS